MADSFRRWWWTFALPGNVRAEVPAKDEAAARAVLVANCYPGAPVASWPLVGSRLGVRHGR